MSCSRTDGRCEARRHRTWAALRRDVASDIRRYGRLWEGSAPAGRLHAMSVLLFPPVACAALHRLAHFLFARGWRRAARAVAWGNAMLFKARISPESCIGAGVYLPHPPGLVFHGRAGADLTLYAHATVASIGLHSPTTLDQAPSLGDRVSVAVHGAVLGPASIGDDVRVAFRTIVMRDVPDGGIVTSRTMRTRIERGERT